MWRALVVLAYFVGVLVFLYLNHEIRAVAERPNIALCTLRADLQQRIRTGEERIAATTAFLDEHPQGFAGIPAATIRASLAIQERDVRNQRKTVASLSTLHC